MPRSQQRGFTLIELLVVIAIISMLASILFPTFRSAREKARQAVCISNQRQLAIAMEMWIQDHSERLPSAETVWQDLGSDVRKILVCPTMGDDIPNGYLYNNALSGLAEGRVQFPLRTILTIDGMHKSTAAPTSTYDNVLYTAQDIDRRHNGHAVCSFMDGHVGLESDITGFAYKPDFSQPVGADWSVTTKSVTPVGGRSLLGELGNQAVTLTLNGLPKHASITVSCDLYIIRAWTGNTGPHAWQLRVVGGDTLLNTTFSNVATANQAYPDAAPGGDHPARTGATETNTLGYEHTPDGVMDAVYHIESTVNHKANSIQLEFSASGLPAITEASWGLANVNVSGE